MTTPTDLFDLGDGPSDMMMLYQVAKEARACRGSLTFEFPHPDQPATFTFTFIARRPVRLHGSLIDIGQVATVTLSFNLNAPTGAPRSAPSPKPDAAEMTQEWQVVEEIVRLGSCQDAVDLLLLYRHLILESRSDPEGAMRHDQPA